MPTDSHIRYKKYTQAENGLKQAQKLDTNGIRTAHPSFGSQRSNH